MTLYKSPCTNEAEIYSINLPSHTHLYDSETTNINTFLLKSSVYPYSKGKTQTANMDIPYEADIEGNNLYNEMVPEYFCD